MIKKKIEELFGLPEFEKVAKVVEKIPDKETLIELNQFVLNLEKLSRNAPDLEKVAEILSILKELDMKEINKAITKLNTLLSKIPKEGLDALLRSLNNVK